MKYSLINFEMVYLYLFLRLRSECVCIGFYVNVILYRTIVLAIQIYGGMYHKRHIRFTTKIPIRKLYILQFRQLIRVRDVFLINLYFQN